MGQSTFSQIGIRYGLITSLALIVYSLVVQLSGYGNDTVFGILSYAVLVIGIFMAHSAFKDQGDGFLSYGQGLGLGSLISAFSGFFVGVFSYIYFKFFDQTTIEMAIEETRIRLEDQGLDDEIIDQTMAISEQFMTPGWLAFFGFIGMIIVGFILSLIVSAFTKKANAEAQF